MRLQTYLLLNVQLDSKSRIKDVKDLFKFKWEESNTTKKPKITVPDWDALEK